MRHSAAFRSPSRFFFWRSITKIKQKWAIPALIVLIIWNGLSLVQYRLGFVSMGNALTIQEMTIDRLLVPFKLAQKFLR